MTPHYADDRVTLWHGDCRDVLRDLPDASVAAVVTDPPYELGFMGKSWDASGVAYDVAVWAECLRVLKPGGHLLAFGGTRTWHRLTVAIEDAGFEIRDSIAWLYGSGFPKSLDVSKAIDRQRTEDRAPVDAVRAWLNARRIDAGFSHDAVNKHFGHASNGGGSSSAWMTNPTSRSLPTWDQWQTLKGLFHFGDEMDAEVWRLNGRKGTPGEAWDSREILSETTSRRQGGTWADEAGTGMFRAGERVTRITAPATEAAQQWSGWGTALKPASEPIVVARKPLGGTVAACVLEHGTGALNIDGCRVEGENAMRWETPRGGIWTTDSDAKATLVDSGQGRWPANVVLTHAPDCGPDDTTPCVDGCPVADLDAQSAGTRSDKASASGSAGRAPIDGGVYAGGAGVGGSEVRVAYADSGGASRFFPVFRFEAKAPTSERPRVDGTAHPTVKPLDLMRWLVRLVTPPAGIVLDPFAGSGTTGEAAALEGFPCWLVEEAAEHLPLITQRLTKRADPVAHLASRGEDLGLFDLLDGQAGL